MVIALNPSPCDAGLDAVDLGKLSWLIMNETEAGQITGSTDPDEAWARLHARYPALSVLITLGSAGSVAYRVTDGAAETVRQEAFRVRAVDTTAAGDTFTGYFIAGLTAGMPLRDCMRRAGKAAAVSVTRMGAAESIPRSEEVGPEA